MKIYSFHNKRLSSSFNLFKHSLSHINDNLELVSSFENFVITPSSNYYTKFLAQHKVSKILEAIKANMGEQIIIADVDILFLKPFSQTLSEDLKDCDMVIATHSKGTRLDTGFMGLNCSTKLLMFFERILPTISISQSALEDSLFKNLHSIKYQLLDRRYANRSNNGLDIYPDECYLFHANFEDRTPRSHHKFRNLRRKWLRIQEGIPRTPPLTPQRNKKLKLKMKSEEAFLENFFSRECLRHQEDDEDLDCEKMWKDYQNELHKPGCKSCVKRKIISKYYNLLKGYE